MPAPKVLILSAAAALLLGVLAIVLLRTPEVPVIRSGTLLPQPRPIPEFSFTDHQGRPFTRAGFKDRWSLVFLGFTHCPDVCPTTLSLLTAVDTKLRASGGEIRTVLVSADPQRDTPEVLAQYLSHFNRDFLGAHAEKAELDKFCSSLGLAYVVNPGKDGEYTVDHSTALVLIDPQARVAGYFQPPFDVDGLVADLSAITASKL